MLAQEEYRGVGKAMGSGWLQRSWIQIVLLALVVGLTFFTNLGEPSPSLMEARNFIAVREITAPGGNWLVPTLNGDVRVAKPPLPTWMTAVAGLAAGDVSQVAALRFPAAVVATLMVLFLYLLARQLVQDRLIPFLAALVLAGSLALFTTGRQGTWDIYCHSFMLGALWLILLGLRQRSAAIAYSVFSGAGLLLGFSFLSKGPVAFYAMLLPFALCYLLYFGRGELQGKGKGLLLALSVCLLVSLPWPLYIALTEPDAFTRVMAGESNAWFDRHVKPLWYYWGFLGQAGIWAGFAAVALFAPYARKRLKRLAPYRFLLLWVLFTLVLLSVMPEKKERYLLPVLPPLALLTGAYLRYLLQACSSRHADKGDGWIVGSILGLLLLLCCALPLAAYTFFYRPGHISPEGMALLVAVPLVLGVMLLLSVRQRHGEAFLVAMVCLNVFVLVVGVPIYRRAYEPEIALRELRKVKEVQELNGYAFYTIEEMSPVYIWEVGKQVKPLNLSNPYQEVTGELPAVVFSLSPLAANNLPAPDLQLQLFHTIRLKEEPLEVYYVYILSK